MANEPTCRDRFVRAGSWRCIVATRSRRDAPPWAFVVNPPDFQRSKDDGSQRHVPDSTLELTLTQVRDRYYAPDWHPEDHPLMPEVVAHGRKPDIWARGFCHRADGRGGPEKHQYDWHDG